MRTVAVAGCECEGCRSIRDDMWRSTVIPFPCPICNRFRLEWRTAGKDGLFVRCTKCGADHDTIVNENMRLSEERDGSNQGSVSRGE